MSISKTTYKTWRVRVDVGNKVDGSRAVVSKTFKTKREAVAYEALMREKARTDVIVRDKIRLEDYVHEWYLPDVEKHVRFNTLKEYKRDLRLRILPMLGNKTVDAITREDVQRLIDSCASLRVAQRARNVIRQVLSSAENKGFVKTNVAGGNFHFPAPEIYPEEHNGVWLTSFDEIDAFLDSVQDERLHMVALLGLCLGLRKGEIFGLDWSDVDFEKRLVHVQRTCVYEKGGYKLMPPKTRESNRYIPMRKRLYDELRSRYSVLNEPCGAIVVNYKNERMSPRHAALRLTKYESDHGLENVSLLNMRHSFATSCLNAGIDVTKVSKLLGHSNITTTVKRYVRFKASDMVDDFNEL
jgi:hypothetical protein